MIDADLIERLRNLLGRRCEHEGARCKIIDLLPADGILVLEVTAARPEIQLDQFGRASHRAPQIRQIPILSVDGDGLSAQMQMLLGCLNHCDPL